MDTGLYRLPWRANEARARKPRTTELYRHRLERQEHPALRAARAVLSHGPRVSGYLFGTVGVAAVLFALTMWLVPGSRNVLATRLAPFMASAPEQEQQKDVLSAIALDAATTSAVNASTGASAAVAAQPVVSDARADHVLSPHEQTLVASWLSRRYHVAQQPVNALVRAASSAGYEVGLDPFLLLAVMGIESSFNPYAQSTVGAQGLMQVMPQVHLDKFQPFGGRNAALNPLANIQVGARVLKDCIVRGGSLVDGLRLYVGSTTRNDGGYGAKVIAERDRLRDVALGMKVATIAPSAPALVVARVSGRSAHRVHATLNGSSLSARETGVPAKMQQGNANARQEEGT